jgi:hypothetical protein
MLLAKTSPPFAVDVCGMADEAATILFKRMGACYGTNAGRTYACAVSICRNRISFVIQLGAAYNLASFILTSPSIFHRVDSVIEMVL